MKDIVLSVLSIAILLGLCVGALAQDFNEIEGEVALNQFLSDAAETPVIVAFTASWCKPCKSLKSKMEVISEDYEEADVLIRWVDADKYKSLQKYLKGGYPTVRVFRSGSLATQYFVGDNSPQKIRDFISGVINPQEFSPTGMGHGETCPIPLAPAG